MAGNKTLMMIKPDAVATGHLGDILKMVENAGFAIKGLKLTRLSINRAKAFYSIHSEKPFFNDLIEFMTSGPMAAVILEKENAVSDYRELIGSTDPAQSAEGTVRNLYGTNVEKNAVHGSDSDENAAKEIAFFSDELGY